MTRLLVVEDSPTQAEELRLILEAEGFEVEAAGDAEAALERMRRSSFDLVISDIMMPGLSGYDLCRKIKAEPAWNDIPIVLLTTLSDPMDVIQGLESGADNFLTKPYEASHLVARVTSILENRRLRAERRLEVGVEIFFLGRKFAITSDKEQILGLLVSTFEDTVRKNRELQASQADLAAAMAKLEAAHRELEAFSYSVSHDLRNPLNAIKGFSELVLHRHEGLDEVARKHLQLVVAASTEMSDLIEQLLRLSRITREQVLRAPVDLGALVRQISTALDGRDRSRRTEWVVADGVVADVDAPLIRIALENLLGNAWKFTGKAARPRIEFGTRAEAGDTTYFVRDNGAGFDPTHGAKLFAPFQRLHSTTEFPGTGLGLAIVQRIVHRHGGRVWAEGDVGRGATFHFTLGAVNP